MYPICHLIQQFTETAIQNFLLAHCMPMLLFTFMLSKVLIADKSVMKVHFVACTYLTRFHHCQLVEWIFMSTKVVTFSSFFEHFISNLLHFHIKYFLKEAKTYATENSRNHKRKLLSINYDFDYVSPKAYLGPCETSVM